MLCQPSHARRVRIGWIAREKQRSLSPDFASVTLGCQGFQRDDVGIRGKRAIREIAMVALDETYGFIVLAGCVCGSRRVNSRNFRGQGRRVQHKRVSGFVPRIGLCGPSRAGAPASSSCAGSTPRRRKSRQIEA
jgi:hypothetical protein